MICNHELIILPGNESVKCEKCERIADFEMVKGRRCLNWRPLKGKETKREAIRRWKREGRWDAVHDAMEDIAKAHRVGRKTAEMSVEESRELAWAEAIESYGPITIPVPAAEVEHSYDYPKLHLKNIAIRKEDAEPDVIEDIRWAYAHLDDDHVIEAPTRSALSMLKWARDERKAFFEKMVPRVIEKIESATRTEDKVDDDDDDDLHPAIREEINGQLDALERMIEDTKG